MNPANRYKVQSVTAGVSFLGLIANAIFRLSDADPRRAQLESLHDTVHHRLENNLVNMTEDEPVWDPSANELTEYNALIQLEGKSDEKLYFPDVFAPEGLQTFVLDSERDLSDLVIRGKSHGFIFTLFFRVSFRRLFFFFPFSFASAGSCELGYASQL